MGRVFPLLLDFKLFSAFVSWSEPLEDPREENQNQIKVEKRIARVAHTACFNVVE